MEKVTTQKRAKLGEAFEIFSENHESMTYRDFIKQESEKEEDLPIEDIENRFWTDKHKTKYALYNDISLFGNGCKTWNLNEFTQEQSIIHAEQPHYAQTQTVS